MIRAAVGVAFVWPSPRGACARTSSPAPSWARAGGRAPSEQVQGLAGRSGQLRRVGHVLRSGYNNPYASLARSTRAPSTTWGRSSRFAERAHLRRAELTTPTTPSTVALYLYDPWVWLSASNLHTFERSRIRIGGIGRVIIPLSPESRYQNMLFGAGGGLNVTGSSSSATSAIPIASGRWSRPTHHLVQIRPDQHLSRRWPRRPQQLPRARDGVRRRWRGGEPGSAASDRCGGPHNPNFSDQQRVAVNLSRGKWFAGVSLLVTNTFNYSFPDDPLSAAAATPTGRSDMTWGSSTSAGRSRDRVSLSWGLSSLQPALDSRYRYPRFPFFDLSGGANANNFTQLLFAVDGVL